MWRSKVYYRWYLQLHHYSNIELSFKNYINNTIYHNQMKLDSEVSNEDDIVDDILRSHDSNNNSSDISFSNDN